MNKKVVNVDINPSISIITLNVNGLNKPIKRQTGGKKKGEIPWQSRGDFMPPLQEAPVQSPIGELRSLKLHGLAEKKKKKDRLTVDLKNNYMLSIRNSL